MIDKMDYVLMWVMDLVNWVFRLFHQALNYFVFAVVFWWTYRRMIKDKGDKTETRGEIIR
ncbi:MAG: hypothetical protein JW778_04380 [Candidatus Altiarchaeota archaeon]|nr:hypothetical protein [Candidatus Altiarchaeota archaeon]